MSVSSRILSTSLLLLLTTSGFALGVSLPDSERVVLDNGVVLILNEKPDVPMIGVRAILRGGAVTDPAGKAGLAGLYASLIEKGAGDRDAAAFAEAVDSVGGRLSTVAGREALHLFGDFLSRDVDLMVELLADMLMRPTLDRAEFEKLRERQINFIRAAKDSDPGQLMSTYANAFLFGDHPYGSPVEGSEASLAAIAHSDIADYYEQQVGGDRLIISVSGDFDTADMRARLEKAFAVWRPASEELVPVEAAAVQPGGRSLLIDKPGATQTYFWIGNVGVAKGFKRRAELDLANTVFGGRFTSMLNDALRVESGLTYGASSRLWQPSAPGTVAIRSYTATETTVEAIDMALGILSLLHDQGVGNEMLASARNYILGQFPTRFETASQIASELADLEFYGFEKAYIDDYGVNLSAVSTDAIAAVIADVYPEQDELVYVFLGDAEQVREQLQKYGPVTELSITEPHFAVAD